MADAPDRIALAPELDIPRIVSGLWQVADMERGGKLLDRGGGFDGHARIRACGLRRVRHGRPLRQRGADRRPVPGSRRRRRTAGAHRPVAFTKWCPAPGPMTAEVVRAGVERELAAPRRRDDRSPAIPLVELRASRLSRRDEGARQAEARRADPPSRGHEFRHGALARRRQARRRDRLQPGLIFASRPPRGGRDERVLPRARGEAPRLWNARRRLSHRAVARARRSRRATTSTTGAR